MELGNAIRAAASGAPNTAIDGFDHVRDQVAALGALDNELRAAHLIGQCAHESVGFTHIRELLSYSSADRLLAIFRRHFRDRAHAAQFVRNPEALANHVYANRMGNGPSSSGDGFRYRGRGYLQLTGRSNYRTFGGRIGIDLEANPERAEEPATAWFIAAGYLASRKLAGKTALQWADENNVEAVTRIVNGGTHGLADRRNRTALALAALGGAAVRPTLRRGDDGTDVELLQQALAAKGFSPGSIDGDFGNDTEAAVRAFQAANGLTVDGVVGRGTWSALES